MNNSAAFLYGKGVFTTIAIRARSPFLWDKHWSRLSDHARRVGLDLSEHAEEITRQMLMKEIERSGVVNGKARITFYDASPAEIWAGDSERKTGLAILAVETCPDLRDFRLTVSPCPTNSRSPLAGIKSCNYLENILALGEAKSRGFHEAIRVNERGEVVSGVMANIFWLKNGEMFTPSLRTGCLAGTTREFVMENLDCVEAESEIEELRNADAIYLTSAGLGVTGVSEFDGRVLNRERHPIEDLLTSVDSE